MSINDLPIVLTAEQALSMLPDGDEVHTFRSTGNALFGADWSRSKLEQAIRENRCEVGGDQCQRMNHGLIVWTSEADALFVECRKGVDYESFAEQGETNAESI